MTANYYVNPFDDTTTSEKSWDDLLNEYERGLSEFTSGNYDVRAEESRGYNGSTSLYNQKYGGDDSLENYVSSNSGQFLTGSDNNWKVELKGASPETVFAGLRKDPRYTALTQYGTFKEQDDGSYRFVKDELSTLQRAAQVAQAATMAGLTAGVGSALGAGLGLSSSVANPLASAGFTALRGGNIEDALKSAALSYAGGALGDRIATGAEFGINPFGEQAGMLASQTSGLGDIYGFLPTTASGITKELVRGKNLEDAVVSGLLSGIKATDLPESSLQFQTPQALKDIGNAIVDVVNPLYQAQKPIGQSVADAAEYLYEAQKPVGQAVADFVDPAYEALKDVGQAIDDTIIDPIDQALRELPDVDMDGSFLTDLFGDFLGIGSTTRSTVDDGFLDRTEFEDFEFSPYRSRLLADLRNRR